MEKKKKIHEKKKKKKKFSAHRGSASHKPHKSDLDHNV